MKHLSHHMIGDTKHGRGEHNQFFREKFDVHRLLLHANKMSFEHPVTKEKLEITAPLDDTFEKLFETFGWDAI